MACFRLLARLIQPRPRHPLHPDRVRRILVYGSMGVGNMVLFTPTLKALRSRFPESHITMLVRRSGCERVIQGSGLVDEVIRTRRSAWETARLIRRIRRRRYDLVISTFHGLPFRAVTGLGRIPWRVGHVSSPGWPHRYDFLYNVQVPMTDGTHEIDRYLLLARAVGATDLAQPPAFYLSDEDLREADAFLRARGVRPGDLLVGMQIDSSRGTEWKRWPLERFAELAQVLARRHGARIVVLGSIGTSAEFGAIQRLAQAPLVTGVEHLPLRQAAAVVKRCDLTICNDSGFMHISGAVGTPVVGVLGPTDHLRTSPLRYGPRHAMVRKDVPCGPCYRLEGADTAQACPDRICFSRIAVADVLAPAERILAELRPRSAGG